MKRTHIILCSVSLGCRKKILKILVVGQLRTPEKQKKNTLIFGTGGAKQGPLTRVFIYIIKALEIREFSASRGSFATKFLMACRSLEGKFFSEWPDSPIVL